MESDPRRILELLGNENATCSDLPMLVDILATRLTQTGEIFIVKWKCDSAYYIGKPEQWRHLSKHVVERLIKYYCIVRDPERDTPFFEWYRPTTAKDCFEKISRRLSDYGKEFALLA